MPCTTIGSYIDIVLIVLSVSCLAGLLWSLISVNATILRLYSTPSHLELQLDGYHHNTIVPRIVPPIKVGQMTVAIPPGAMICQHSLVQHSDHCHYLKC